VRLAALDLKEISCGWIWRDLSWILGFWDFRVSPKSRILTFYLMSPFCVNCVDFVIVSIA